MCIRDRNTGDARESPALDVIRILLEEGPGSIAIFDPLCNEADIKRELSVLESGHAVFAPAGPVQITSDPYAACADSHAVLVLTDWDMFKIGKLAAPPTKPIAAPENFDGTAPSDVLHLNPRPEPISTDKPLTPPRSPKSSSLPSEMDYRPAPEPPCPADCAECQSCSSASGEPVDKDLTTPLDWSSISRSVKEPRWVFDGRGMLDARAMVGMGFRLETLGRASMY